MKRHWKVYYRWLRMKVTYVYRHRQELIKKLTDEIKALWAKLISTVQKWTNR